MPETRGPGITGDGVDRDKPVYLWEWKIITSVSVESLETRLNDFAKKNWQPRFVTQKGDEYTVVLTRMVP